MSFDYINEAFKRLEALNEDVFDTSLTGVNTLSDFMDQDDASDIVKVIDPDADTEQEVSDSYVGKVIINCNVCHSHIFESKDDITIDEDGVVNAEMQCPYCGEMSGFTVVGEIMPFNPDEGATDEQPEQETSTEEDKEETDTAEVADSDELQESLDSYSTTSDLELLKTFLRSKGYDCNSKKAVEYLWGVVDLFQAGEEEITPESVADWYEETCINFPEDLDILRSTDTFMESTKGEELIDEETWKKIQKLIGMLVEKTSYRDYGDDVCIMSDLNDQLPDMEKAHQEIISILKKNNFKVLDDNYMYNEYMKTHKSYVTIERPKQKNEDCNSCRNSKNESIEDLHMTANNTDLDITEDETGKVTVSMGPASASNDEATMSPVSDATIQEIENNNSIAEEPVETTDDTAAQEPTEPQAEEQPEEPAEDAQTPEEEGELVEESFRRETETVDLEIDEISEEDLNTLGETYLKETYRNIESFKTTNVSTTDSSMIVEGTITFKSGARKNTGFIFEAHSASADGRVKFCGMNEHFSKDAKAFTLTGSVKNNKLLPESLEYNYHVGTDHIHGTVTTK